MNAGQPGREIIPPGQSPGLTGILHHGTFSFVPASWLSGSPGPFPLDILRACLVAGWCGYEVSPWAMECLGLLVWTAVQVGGS